MRHGHKLPRFSGSTKRRAALLKNLATALVKHERITTTVAKAKAMKKYGDKIITLGKRGDWRSKLRADMWMKEPGLVDKLFGPLALRYQDRPGGYTRVLRIPNRKGDNAPMAIIEYVDNDLPSLLPTKGMHPLIQNRKMEERVRMKRRETEPQRTDIPLEGTPV
ncbi:large ribosomal subunit protein bL17-like [Corticium candelabrum]|uniref:large ribosomal subunit protein bL17-like n=1 Tax=Corticium candelabrum TaxID=121492 RepID=UPI002E26A495|nr:large ribosomal subunit protein bL17-like [Corticium candelabrum]